jgi:hypothetical protein
MRIRPTIGRDVIEAAYAFVDRYNVKKEVQDALIRNGVAMEDVVGPRRFSEICRARAVIFLLLKEAGATSPAIARIFRKHVDTVEHYAGGPSRRASRFAQSATGGSTCR